MKRCHACRKAAQGVDRYSGKAWCASCWEAYKARTLSWVHEAPALPAKPAYHGTGSIDNHQRRMSKSKGSRG